MLACPKADLPTRLYRAASPIVLHLLISARMSFDRDVASASGMSAFSGFHHCLELRLRFIVIDIKSGFNGRWLVTKSREAGLSAMAGLGGDDLLSTSDVARLLGLASDYVRRLARKGNIPTAIETRAGYKFFKRSDVVEFARTHSQTQPRHGRPRRDLSLELQGKPEK